jgi:hypothetical protein
VSKTSTGGQACRSPCEDVGIDRCAASGAKEAILGRWPCFQLRPLAGHTQPSLRKTEKRLPGALNLPSPRHQQPHENPTGRFLPHPEGLQDGPMTELILLGCGADYTSCALTPPSLPPRYKNVMTSPPGA